MAHSCWQCRPPGCAVNKRSPLDDIIGFATQPRAYYSRFLSFPSPFNQHGHPIAPSNMTSNTALDPDRYPDILDLVIAYAAADSLLPLRYVSRYVKKIVDRRLFNHIKLSSSASTGNMVVLESSRRIPLLERHRRRARRNSFALCAMTEIKSTAQIKIDGELHDGRTEGLFPAGADLRDALRHVRLLDLQDLGGLGLVDAIGVNASTVRMSLMPTYPTPAAELEPVAWPAHLTPSTVWVTVLPNNPAPVISIRGRRIILIVIYDAEGYRNTAQWYPQVFRLEDDQRPGEVVLRWAPLHKTAILNSAISTGLDTLLAPFLGLGTRLTAVNPPHGWVMPVGTVVMSEDAWEAEEACENEFLFGP